MYGHKKAPRRTLKLLVKDPLGPPSEGERGVSVLLEPYGIIGLACVADNQLTVVHELITFHAIAKQGRQSGRSSRILNKSGNVQTVQYKCTKYQPCIYRVSTVYLP